MTKITILNIAGLAAASLVSAQVRQGDALVPPSSIAQDGDAGKRMHTQFGFYAPNGEIAVALTSQGIAPATQDIETPPSLACIYSLVPNLVSGCPTASTTEVPSGGSAVIVIVDAYDQPAAAADLAAFSAKYGLPQANFSVIYVSGSQPENGCASGWAAEEDLDIQYAHAMAPDAQIVLMEAADSSTATMFGAVSAANAFIATHGGEGEVSMSWGTGESNSETSYDSYFTQPGVVYFASAGDVPGTQYPSVSPNVVAAGGTQINRNGSGDYTNQTAWNSGGGGQSQYESRPSFQDGVMSIVGTQRGAPDISFNSSFNSLVSVYGGCAGGWVALFGTSVAAPSLAGIFNNAGGFNVSSIAENTAIYENIGNTSDFTDITSGNCGAHSAMAGYDLCTGVGVVNGYPKKTDQTITFAALSNELIGIPPFAITATASSGLPVTFTSTTVPVCTVSGDMVTLVKTGKCSITAGQAGDEFYYAAAPVPQSFRITSGSEPQTITFPPLPNEPYGTPPITLSASASSDLPVSFGSTTAATCTVSGDQVALVMTGRCAIKATQPGNATFAPATPVIQAFTITKDAQNITFGALSNQPINAAPFTVSAMASSGLPVGFSSTTTTTCTVSADTVMLVAAGRCAIKASQAGNVDYDGATPVTQAFTITKLTQTIDFPSLQNQTLGTAPFTISATASSGLTVSFASTTTTVCTVTGDTVTLVATGHCSIKATEAGNGTYDAAKPVEQGFQVKQ